MNLTRPCVFFLVTCSFGLLAQDKPSILTYITNTEIDFFPQLEYEDVQLLVAGPEGVLFNRHYLPGEDIWFEAVDDQGNPLPDGHYRFEVRLWNALGDGPYSNLDEPKLIRLTGRFETEGGSVRPVERAIRIDDEHLSRLELGGTQRRQRNNDWIDDSRGIETGDASPSTGITPKDAFAGDVQVGGGVCTACTASDNVPLGDINTGGGICLNCPGDVDTPDGDLNANAICSLCAEGTDIPLGDIEANSGICAGCNGTIDVPAGDINANSGICAGCTPGISTLAGELQASGTNVSSVLLTNTEEELSDWRVRNESGDLEIEEQGASPAVIIKSGAPADSIFVEAGSGNVGLGTSVPETSLHVLGEGGTQIRLEDTSATTAPRTMIRLENKGRPALRFNNTVASGATEWSLEAGDNGDFLWRQNTGTNPGIKLMVKDNSGDLIVPGDVITSSCPAGCGPADFVFEPDYELMPLKELAEHVRRERHLPNIPPANELTRGVKITWMQMRFLEKIEELTLYTIQQEERIDRLRQKSILLAERLADLEESMNSKGDNCLSLSKQNN